MLVSAYEMSSSHERYHRFDGLQGHSLLVPAKTDRTIENVTLFDHYIRRYQVVMMVAG